MKKNLFLAGLLTTFSLVAKSQVGLNTPTPAATLDVTAKNSTGTGSAVEGLLIPRVDRQKAQSMAGVPVSTLIYVNNIATGTTTGTAVNIDTVGYYYYNGTVWTKLANPVNIYNTDGTLTGNRTVTQGANTLAFTGTKTNAFSVNGKNFSVDAANSRVGIGTIAPASSLSVQNSPGATTSTISAGIENCGAACLQGIARNITLYNLNSTGGQFAELGFIPSTSETGLSGASISGIDRDAANSYAGLQFSTRNATDYAPRLTIKSSGNVGIGTTSPTNKLQIESTTSGALKIVDGTQGTDKVLTSDASGVATWKALPAAPASANIYNTDGSLTGNRTVTQGANTLAFTGTQTNAFSVDGNTLSVDAANGLVGLGTTTPDTKLTISTPDSSFGLNHTNGTVNLKTYIGGGAATVGTTTANDLRLMTNNTQKMTVTSSGNVGIGTTTPNTKLTVSTADNSFGITHTNGTVSLETYIGGGSGYVGTTTSNTLNLMTNNSPKMTITPTGNVGVGTNTPDSSALLDLNTSNKGLLLPRVSLSSTSDTTTVPSPATGLLVYNNNTAMSPQGEGIYYNGGTSAAPDWGKIGPVSKMYFKYYMLTNPNGDFVGNFDTKIPVDRYTAIVVGFDTNHHATISSGFKNAYGTYDFQSPDIYTFQQNGTWRIHADVPNANTTAGSAFTWGIRLLIISNEQMTTLDTSNYNLGGNITGAAAASPVP
ncbi:hypothetical protein J2795_000583 [Chryseobacterium bernardetii]|uniref:Uncharacterized protein n=2 Tax=Chryseobacterium TaxID=59732 RepID=A0A543EMH0_9FLAO|nr:MULTISPECIES: hypothetical protein [Chryseobacterium]MDR6369180.1 hypothetical protein [Chryseobacterium vietnamense]MDR6439898.1 hypothetical protein [Chryseobacterium bernardetii]TQM22783.1 hypothetical protein FB551_2504 [Chryseobacterium aquifrigidense]